MECKAAVDVGVQVENETALLFILRAVFIRFSFLFKQCTSWSQETKQDETLPHSRTGDSSLAFRLKILATKD
jgi:hypothetical protein